MSTRMGRVLGVFGGAFDPPHLGHVLLPAYLRARGIVDAMIVAPCADHPLGKQMSPFSTRLRWTRNAMACHGAGVMVTDLEAALAEQHGAPSFTLRLLQALAERHPGDVVRLVVGSDIVAKGETARWHRWDLIERDFAPIVVPRAGYAATADCPLPELSSSAVRERWARGDWDALASMVPASVLRELRHGPSGRVWVIGRGHVGQHAERWLSGRGYAVDAVSSRALLGGTGIPSEPPDGIWVAVRDAEIPKIDEVLAKILKAKPEVPVVHAAGAVLGREGLSALARRGHPVGTLHPIHSLRRETFAADLEHAVFAFEGDDAAREMMRAWCGHALVLDLQDLDAPGRRSYHAACALVANHLPVLLVPASEALEARGYPPEAVWTALCSLLQSAVANLRTLGVPDGVTGPAARGELSVIEAHAVALPPEAAAVYRWLSERLVQILARAPARGEGRRP